MRGDITRGLWRGSRTFRGLNARYRRRINAAVADGWCWRAEAKGEAESGDGHSTTPTQSAAEYREYELIWLMQQRLPAVSWPHWRLCCMQPRGDPSACHASRALRVLSSCVMCLAPPAVDLLEALRRCVCTRRACCFGSESPLRAPFGRIDGMVATPSAIAVPQRVVASNFFKVVLANVDIFAATALTLTASRRLRDALKSCSQRHLTDIDIASC